jgi:hypothetical protein
VDEIISAVQTRDSAGAASTAVAGTGRG